MYGIFFIFKTNIHIALWVSYMVDTRRKLEGLQYIVPTF